METVTLELAEKIMGVNFIGAKQLSKIQKSLNISDPLKIKKIPEIQFSKKLLEKFAKDYILILGIPKNIKNQKLTLNQMREFYGIDPKKQEPCFYNQDWYLGEPFAKTKTLELKWYMIRKEIDQKSRAVDPENLKVKLEQNKLFPTAILTAFTFFANYFLNNKMLWQKDFIWCEDKDSNGDRIYTGRYSDPKRINKNGFNIHRHLSIKSIYGLADTII